MSFPSRTLPVSPITAVLDNGLHRIAALGGELPQHANRIGQILWSPPRIVVVGRLKAGKSTLVNALIGAPVAETAALEATHVVTIYADGAPSRAEAVGIDGARIPIPIGAGPIDELPIPADQIAYIQRWLPSAAIRDLTLIDTPGLATLTVANESATRRALIDGFAQTRAASVDADAAVFLFDATPRADEIDFIKRLPFTPLNTLGVLSRADGFGEGALGRRNPLEHAAQHARLMESHLVDVVAAVVPVSGLLAQTCHTGQLTERDAAALAQLQHLSPLALVELLESEDLSAQKMGLTTATRDRLLDLLGEYGMINGRRVAARGAAELNQWLVECSGVKALRHLLQTSLNRFATLHRAQRVLASIDELAFTHPARDSIRTIAFELRSSPELLPVSLIADLHRLLESDPTSESVAEIRAILVGTTPAAQLGIAPESTPEQVKACAAERLSRAQYRAAMGTSSAAEDAALTTLTQAYTGLAFT